MSTGLGSGNSGLYGGQGLSCGFPGLYGGASGLAAGGGPDTTAPAITSDDPSGSYAEGVAVGGTLVSNEVVAWSVSGADAAAVTLDAETGAWSLEATDYETKTSYSFTFTATDAALNTADQVVSITITDVDDTAPTLSSPTDAANGTASADLSVSTNEANGTLYWFISGSATPPSAANLKAGTGAVAFDNQAVTATGVQPVAASGLEPETQYYSYFLHRDNAGNDSSVSAADGFTTDAVTINPPALTLTDDTVNPPHYDVDFADTNPAIAGDTVRITWAYNSGFTSATTEDEVLDTELLTGNLGGAFPLWDAGLTPGQTVYWKLKVLRNPGEVDEIDSGWSNTLSAVLPAPGANVTMASGGGLATGATTTWSKVITFADDGRPLIYVLVNVATISSITLSGGTGVVMSEVIRENVNVSHLWAGDIDIPAGAYTVTVTFGTSEAAADIYGMTLISTTGAATDTTQMNHTGSDSDPKDFNNSLVTPTDGIGAVAVFCSDGTTLDSCNGEIIGNFNRGDSSFLAFIKYEAGTVTPQWNAGATGNSNGVGGAWNGI